VQATLTGRGVKIILLQACESSENLDEIDASLQAGKDNQERRFIATVPGENMKLRTHDGVTELRGEATVFEAE